MASYPVRIVGADRIARNMQAAAIQIRSDVDEAKRELGDIAELIYNAHAPHKSGRLGRGIVARDLGAVVQVEAHARNPASGYDYVGVTRFGHRVARIYPRSRFARRASVVATRNERGRGRRAALRIPMGGGVIYRASVRGYHPTSDWADRALPQIEAEARKVAERLGEKVASRI